MDYLNELQQFLKRHFYQWERKILKGLPRFECFLGMLSYCLVSAVFDPEEKFKDEIELLKSIARRKQRRKRNKSIFIDIERYLRLRKARKHLMISESAEGSSIETVMIYAQGKAKEIPLRHGQAPSRVFVDQLSFVMNAREYIYGHEFVRSDLSDLANKFHGPIDLEKECVRRDFQDIAIKALCHDLMNVFGFAQITERKNGMNGYARSFQMGSEPKAFNQTAVNYGHIMIGGNRDTLCVSITGTGLTASLDGWEKRLYLFAAQHEPHFHLTRIDLARDFFQGEYNIEQMEKDYQDNGFTLRNVKPICDKQGVDWHNPGLNKGRTFYVGSRKHSSRIIRGYEKGKQLGDESSPWFRLEIEYRRRDLILPIDMIIHPTAYYCEYRACQACLKGTTEAKKIDRIKKQINISYSRAKFFYSQQVGRFVNFLVDMGQSYDEIVALLRSQVYPHEYPKRLDPRSYDVNAMECT